METLIKVEFTSVSETGEVSRKYLEGAGLEKWQQFNAQVATFAYVHRANPDWSSIKWEVVGKYDDNDD